MASHSRLDQVLHSINLTASLLDLLGLRNGTTEDRCPPGQSADYPPSSSPDFLRNISYPFDDRWLPAWEVAVKSTFYAIAMVMATLGNALVIATILLNKKLQRPTYVYIANLAVSDLVVGIFNMWMHLVPNIIPSWPLGSCLCEISIFIRILVVTASVLFLTVIAAERFFSVVCPIKTRFARPIVHTAVIIITWLASFAVAWPNVKTRQLYSLYWKDYDQRYCSEVWPREIQGPDPTHPGECLYVYPSRQLYYTIQVTVLYFLPIAIMMVMYTVIVYTLYKRQLPGNQSDVMLELHSRTRRKVIRMLVIVFGVFVVCYTPQQTVVLYVNAYDISKSVPSWLQYATIYIAYFNSALNPILYAGLNENFRKGFREVVSCRRRSNKVIPTADLVKKRNGQVNLSDTQSTKHSPQKSKPTSSTEQKNEADDQKDAMTTVQQGDV